MKKDKMTVMLDVLTQDKLFITVCHQDIIRAILYFNNIITRKKAERKYPIENAETTTYTKIKAIKI
ncbi:Uncharacterised protein [Moraxella equi]|uniref:Uncharacterized protein n=1 Tax=Moraxella equi TaxID=60442 RepID=A0A378QR95_9GAMM|nr:Uncharacterised protein [Moraxella equi]